MTLTMTKLTVENIAVVVFLTVVICVSYQVSAFSRFDEENLLCEALDDSYEPNSDSLPDSYAGYESLPADKRYARLSYNYANRNRDGGRRYFSSRYYANYYTPWLNLADKECFRDQCERDSDCCRRYSICDKSARVCYNCWYGHPCKTSRDCCEAYPYCNRHLSMCQGE